MFLSEVFMASDLSFLQYVVDQLASLRDIGYKKMFGEYCVYLREIPVFLVCDNTTFVKILPETSELLGADCETGYPYDGAKLHYVLDIDDAELACAVANAVAKARTSEKRKGNK